MENGDLAKNNGIFHAIKLDTFRQSAREMPKGRKHQHQPSSRASEKPAAAFCISACQWTRVYSAGGFSMLTGAGEQSHVSTVETGGGSANR